MVTYHDPYIPRIKTENETYQSVKLSEETLQESDCVVITTNHSVFDIDFIVINSKLIVDLRNATNEVSDKIYKL